jgi:hypothetical protein
MLDGSKLLYGTLGEWQNRSVEARKREELEHNSAHNPEFIPEAFLK